MFQQFTGNDRDSVAGSDAEEYNSEKAEVIGKL